MDKISLWTILSTTISLLGISYLWFWAFPKLRMEQFKQSIFSLRDELFDYANAGNISFSDPAYLRLRTMFNGYLRYCEKLNLMNFLVYAAFKYCFRISNHSRKFKEDWHSDLAHLSPEVRKHMSEMMHKASMALFHHLLLSSYTKRLLIYPPILVISFLKVLFNLKRLWAVAVDVPNIEKRTYRISTKNHSPIKKSIDSFNAGAFIYGKSTQEIFGIKHPKSL